MSFADFDRYCEEHDVPRDAVPAAFADWLAEQTGTAIIGGPVGEPPEVVAIPASAAGSDVTEEHT
ncbi:MAG: hypothetical protein M3540_07700 [Actinomycetota bacterium]|nr:hypothetical protein [Actinomycetota bacterium]